MKLILLSSRCRRRLFSCLASVALGAAAPLTAASQQAPVEQVKISARPITQFRIGHQTRNFGPLEFIGGLEMTSGSQSFGSVSSFRFLSPGSDFIAVADTGMWLFGKVVHDDESRPSAITGATMQAMVDENGNIIDRKWDIDAEGLYAGDGVATVSFERNHRVARFRIEPQDMKPPFATMDFLVPKHELRQNKGFETIARAPADGQLKGSMVVVSERSIDRNGDVFAAILEGPGKGVFTVKRHDDFDITDGAFLPDGDLLLLERRYNVVDGVAMRIRRIAAPTIRAGHVADGPVLLSADMGYQIDNMEGLDVWRRADGALMVSLMSDDNHSILQRNLYLEFRLHDEKLAP